MSIEKVGKATFKTDNVSTCPTCGHKLDAFTNTQNDEAPEEGDVTICIECTSYLGINKDLTLKLLTADEFAELPSDAISELTRLRTIIQKINDGREK